MERYDTGELLLLLQLIPYLRKLLDYRFVGPLCVHVIKIVFSVSLASILNHFACSRTLISFVILECLGSGFLSLRISKWVTVHTSHFNIFVPLYYGNWIVVTISLGLVNIPDISFNRLRVIFYQILFGYLGAL